MQHNAAEQTAGRLRQLTGIGYHCPSGPRRHSTGGTQLNNASVAATSAETVHVMLSREPTNVDQRPGAEAQGKQVTHPKRVSVGCFGAANAAVHCASAEPKAKAHQRRVLIGCCSAARDTGGHVLLRHRMAEEVKIKMKIAAAFGELHPGADQGCGRCWGLVMHSQYRHMFDDDADDG